MPHLHHDDARKFQGDKLEKMTGHRGEYLPDKAARLAGNKETNADAQGDAARSPEEVFIAAPPRQVSNYGKVRE
jgi:hypothetical protein